MATPCSNIHLLQHFYIREAEIYSEQRKQRHIIDICDKGLNKVDTKDTHYSTLQHVKTDAEQCQHTRIDFITQLPTDIVITTLIRMFVDDRAISSLKSCPCLHVSSCGVIVLSNCSMDYYSRLAMHLSELVLHFCLPNAIDNVLNAIHDLRQLQRLIITFSEGWESCQMETFLDGLGNGCPRLSYLDIACINAPSTRSMGVLKRLEYLEEFLFSFEETNGDGNFWHAIELKSIRIYCSDEINMDDTRHLQQQRPDLKNIMDKAFCSG